MSLPWIFLSLGQAVAHAVFSGVRRSRLPAFSFLWFVAGSAGGILLTVAESHSSGFGDLTSSNPVGLVEWLVYSARYASLIVLFYGVPTGLTLTAFIRVSGRAERMST